MKFKFLLFGLFVFGIGLGIIGFWFLGRGGISGGFIRNAVNIKTKTNFPTFSLDEAPKLSVLGEISSASGKILWQSRTATESSPLLDFSKKIQQGEKLIASASGTISLVYKDYGDVKLSSDSELNIVQTLPQNFVFEEVKGAVDFLSLGKTNFAVRVGRLLISFKKGELGITLDKEGKVVSCDVINGQADFAFNDSDFNSQTFKLSAGQKFVFDNLTRTRIY
jgi:hypothetical protein